MKKVYAIADQIISGLGTDTDTTWHRMLNGETGVRRIDDPRLYAEPFWAALVDTDALETAYASSIIKGAHTRFEKLCLLTALGALGSSRVNPSAADTLFVLSTTKGNIDLLEKKNATGYEKDRLSIWHTGQLICDFFRNPNKPLIISNACISGVLALVAAADYLRRGHYRNAVVIGADIASEFVISGFQSFISLCEGPCKPFDASRNGLNLGEGAGAIVLSSDPEMVETDKPVELCGGASANDANHISGPSRTGEGLYVAVQRALEISGVSASDVDYLSAHGTATPFNDEMESKAFSRAGLSKAPLNSMKGYFGHTLGAAGVIETAVCLRSMRENILLKTLGYSEYGVPEPITILSANTASPVNTCVKTASGFGGSNAALVLKKAPL